MKKSNSEDVFKSVPNYFENVSVISTRIFALDFITKGGIETGSTYQLVGESGCGKTTIALSLARNICEQNKHVVYIDSEGSVSRQLLESLDLIPYMDTQLFTYIRENTFSKVEELLDSLLVTNEVSLVIVDSLATLVNEGFTDLRGGLSITTKNTYYTTGPLVLFMNKYKSLAMSKKFSLVVINQYRNTIDMRKGTILKEYGAKAVKYNSDVIIRIGPIKSNSRYYKFTKMTKPFEKGTELCFEIIKSNKSFPTEHIPFYLLYGKGISNVCNYLYALQELNVITQSGGYYKVEHNNRVICSRGIKDFYNQLISFFDFEAFMSYIENFYKELMT